jgi:hypothetical protein
MRKEFLISMSALALIASAGTGSAQDRPGAGGAGGQAPAAQQQPAMPGSSGRMDSGSQPSQQPRQEDPRDNRAQNPSGRAQAQDQRAPQRENQDRAQQERPTSNGDMKADSKSRKDSTTGQGAAGSSGGASLTTEQRTRISTTIRQSNVRPVTNVNFNIAVGTEVPRSVTLHPLPAAVIEVYPDWRPYRFVLVGDEILVIDPATHRIVAILEA